MSDIRIKSAAQLAVLVLICLLGSCASAGETLQTFTVVNRYPHDPTAFTRLRIMKGFSMREPVFTDVPPCAG